MPLNSLVFLFGFLPLVAMGAFWLRDHVSAGAAQAWVLAASLVFYIRDDPSAIALLLAAIGFNWGVARSMASAGRGADGRKRLLLLGLAVDIGVLCVFKYLNPVAAWLGGLAGVSVQAIRLPFPLGISFFILTQVMYLVDCYEKLIPPNSLFDHATFISFFPNITAGPLMRAKLFRAQRERFGDPENRDARLASSIALIVLGLGKKVVLGDSFGRVADAGYAHVFALSTLETWLTSLSYTFHMYFDFSGYSDMAVGAAGVLGITLVRNFNTPFRAVTISDFWQRWHISLSTFIGTYLYTPLVRAMGGVTVHTNAIATFIAMCIVGLWHGAAWRFVLFYVMHGVGLAAYQYWKRAKRPMSRPVALVATFLFVNLAFVVFRSPTFGTMLAMSRQLIPGTDLGTLTALKESLDIAEVRVLGLPLLIGSVCAFAGPTSNEVAERAATTRYGALAVGGILLTSLVFMSATGASAFIYRAF